MTWETVTAVISVITVGIAIGRIIYELSKTLTRLNFSVESLNATLSDFVSINEKEHEEMYGEIETLRESIINLESDVKISEKEEKI